MSENANTISRINVGGVSYELKSNVVPKETTWAALKELVDSNTLAPGLKYRIVDYVATINTGSIYKHLISADVKFNVIVEALTTNTLSEIATACVSTEDTSMSNYFSNSNLGGWKIKYCFFNDINRFPWANENNGKGVIYWMEDEYGNSAYYDFKGIKVILNNESTFTFGDSDKDNSLDGSCANNKIERYGSYPSYINIKTGVNNNIGTSCSNIKISNATNTKIGNSCHNITINESNGSTIGNNVYNVQFLTSSGSIANTKNLLVGSNNCNLVLKLKSTDTFENLTILEGTTDTNNLTISDIETTPNYVTQIERRDGSYRVYTDPIYDVHKTLDTKYDKDNLFQVVELKLKDHAWTTLPREIEVGSVVTINLISSTDDPIPEGRDRSTPTDFRLYARSGAKAPMTNFNYTSSTSKTFTVTADMITDSQTGEVKGNSITQIQMYSGSGGTNNTANIQIIYHDDLRKYIDNILDRPQVLYKNLRIQTDDSCASTSFDRAFREEDYVKVTIVNTDSEIATLVGTTGLYMYSDGGVTHGKFTADNKTLYLKKAGTRIWCWRSGLSSIPEASSLKVKLKITIPNRDKNSYYSNYRNNRALLGDSIWLGDFDDFTKLQEVLDNLWYSTKTGNTVTEKGQCCGSFCASKGGREFIQIYSTTTAIADGYWQQVLSGFFIIENKQLKSSSTNFSIIYRYRKSADVNVNWSDWEYLDNSDTKKYTDTAISKSNEEILKRIQGISENSNPSTDPFKLLITLDDINKTDSNGTGLNSALNSIVSTSPEDNYAGQWRINIATSAYTLHNIVKHYLSNQWMQVISFPFKPSSDGSRWSIQPKMLTLYRSYENPEYEADPTNYTNDRNYWTSWTDLLDEVNSDIDQLNQRISELFGDSKGSVNDLINTAISSLVGTAPGTLDTIQEIAEWIENDEDGAAAMAVRINSNTNAITAEQTRAVSAESTLTSSLSDEITRAKAAEGELIKLIQGTSDNSSGVTEPFVYLGTILSRQDLSNYIEINVDTLIPEVVDGIVKNVGTYRIYKSSKNSFYELKVDALGWENKVFTQMMSGTIKLDTATGKLEKSNHEFNQFYRESSKGSDDEVVWGDWKIVNNSNIRDLILTESAKLDEELLEQFQGINITYSELKKLYKNSQLLPNQVYRIIDYVTTTTQENTLSAGHQFDILVKALTENTISEDAKACLHDNNYFNNNISSWEIKYCIENDSTRFAWADTENGKGVIYYMKDEFGNEASYDFKNIQFLRNYDWFYNNSIISGDSSEERSVYANDMINTLTSVIGSLDRIDSFFYTFSLIDSNGNISDNSLNPSVNNNRIGSYTASNKVVLNNTLFINANSGGPYNNSIKEGNAFNIFCGKQISQPNNTIEVNYKYNNVFSSFNNNTIGKSFQKNIIKAPFYWNNIGNKTTAITIGSDFFYNNLGHNTWHVKTGYKISYCNIGSYFQYNSFIKDGNYESDYTEMIYCNFGSGIEGVDYIPPMQNITFEDKCWFGSSSLAFRNLRTTNGELLIEKLIKSHNQNLYVYRSNGTNNGNSETRYIILTANSSIYSLGSFENSSDAENKAASVDICTNPDISLIKYHINNRGEGIIEQNINLQSNTDTYYTTQYLNWDGYKKVRQISFSKNTESDTEIINIGEWKTLVNSNNNNVTLFSENSVVINSNSDQVITGIKTFNNKINLLEKSVISSTESGELKISHASTGYTSNGFSIKNVLDTNDLEITNISGTGSNTYKFPKASGTVAFETINITYSELKRLYRDSQLLPGQKYRITDYVTTTTQENTMSAGHQFDLIVTAVTNDTICEKVCACLHEGDDYFPTNYTIEKRYNLILNHHAGSTSWSTASGTEVSTMSEIIDFAKENNIANPDIVFAKFTNKTLKKGRFYVQINPDSTTIGSMWFLGVDLIKGGVVVSKDYHIGRQVGNYNDAFSNYSLIVPADGQYTIRLHIETTKSNKQECYIDLFGDELIDTYNYSINLWDIKYDINNNSTKYSWADTENGKGVIYYMKDEFGNEAPYDFKNIMFKKPINNKGVYDIDGKDSYVYTFSHLSVNNLENDDFSINAIDYSIFGNTNEFLKNYYNIDGCYGNTIKPCYSSENSSIVLKQVLNETVFLQSDNPKNQGGCYLNKLDYNNKNNIFGDNCYGNILGDNCINNIFKNCCTGNILDGWCKGNLFDIACDGNTLRTGCWNNVFGMASIGNTLGNGCTENKLGDSCCYNTIAGDCHNNILDGECYSNTFGNSCYDNILGYNCCSNIFEAACNSNIFGNVCNENTIGIDCNNIIFGADKDNLMSNYRHITIESGNKYINLYGHSTATTGGSYQNVRIGLGVNNTDNVKLITDPNTNQDYETYYRPANSKTVEI